MKIQKGFTLLEVLLALTILIGSVTIYSSLQIRVIDRLLKGRDEVERIFLLKKDLFKFYFSPPKNQRPVIQNLEKPELKISTEFVDIQKKSELNSFIDTARFIKCSGIWKRDLEEFNLDLFGLVLKPEDKNKNV